MNSNGVSGKTLIVYPKGVKPISEVEVGESVLTDDGYKVVKEVVCVNKPLRVFEYVLKSPKGYYHLTTSPHNAIMTQGGDVEMSRVGNKDAVMVLMLNGKQSFTHVSAVWGIHRPSEEMYNLILEDGECFFANGVLIGSYEDEKES